MLSMAVVVVERGVTVLDKQIFTTPSWYPASAHHVQLSVLLRATFGCILVWFYVFT